MLDELGKRIKKQAEETSLYQSENKELDLEIFPQQIRKIPSEYMEVFNGSDPEFDNVHEEEDRDPVTHEFRGYTDNIAIKRKVWSSRWRSGVTYDDIEPETIEISLRDLNEDIDVSLKDVGVGISQLLPVIVSSIDRSNTALMIEQPELHVHPALQAEMGDLFIEGANQHKNRFIIETHSEHLILRLLRRIRETSLGELPDKNLTLNVEDLNVYYIKPGSRGAEIVRIEVTEQGDFSGHWPAGFFADRSKELF